MIFGEVASVISQEATPAYVIPQPSFTKLYFAMALIVAALLVGLIIYLKRK